MNRISSIIEIQKIVQSVKNERNGFITNFFLDASKHNSWIQNNNLYCQVYDKCFFLLRHYSDFCYVFYISTNLQELKNGIEKFVNDYDETLVIDIINRGEHDIVNLFIPFGFCLYETLYRMNRVGVPIFQDKEDKYVFTANFEDGKSIKRLLDTYFNPYSEQIPTLQEISGFIEDNRVLVYKDGSKILGFIIYELNGFTLYLRYWFVSPEYRDLHIGSKLFNAFMKAGAQTKRQIFWVIASNDNAIKRYQHYGFVAEKLFDYVLIKNKI